ncbi:NACHT domain-containing protein [Amycolatopsis sp. NPDC059027]|uniref:NACHT domain-containing protein n=1 Tax=Amycolatopsis sp. NPDC059027 TaxID=3346709 RepID=UPI00366B917C
MTDTGSSKKRFAGLAVLGSLPVVGLGVWWGTVAEDRVLTVVLSVSYLALLAMGGFFRDVWRELRQRWTGRVADRTDQAVRMRLSRYARRYRRVLAASLRYVDLRGLAVVGFYTPELDEVYVDVSLMYQAPDRVPAGLLTDDTGTGRLKLGTLIGEPKPVVLAVLGAPGSGKTTLLRHTARHLCRSRRGRRPIPVLLFLRDHAAAIVANPQVALSELIGRQVKQYGIDGAAGWFELQLSSGRCVVQLDGFDEVADQRDRTEVARWVERQCTRYARNDFVITSRPQGYRSARVEGAVVLQVRPFTDEQVDAFVRAWYLAVESRASAGDGRAAAKARSLDLLDRLKRSPELYELTVNPLLLTMIANVHRESGALPGSRAELYGEICRVVLRTRQEAKDLPVLGADVKESLLQRLAFDMMQRRSRDVSRDGLLSALRRRGPQRTEALTAEDLLADLTSNGLLIEREPDAYSFAHQTLQEYLAAEHVRTERLERVLVENVTEPWWRETTLLYAARTPADAIVRACLESTDSAALLLAVDCAEQGTGLSQDLHAQVEQWLEAAHSSTAPPDLRKQVAGSLVTRELRGRIRIGDTAAVCRSPVSVSTYSLYRDFPGGGISTTQPASGLGAKDATGLVRWVNKATTGGPSYRLPSFDEVETPSVRAMIREAGIGSLWITGEDGPELWTYRRGGDPYEIDAETVRRRVDADLRRPELPQTRLMLLWLALAISKADGGYARKLLGRIHSGNGFAAPVTRLDEALGLQVYPGNLLHAGKSALGEFDWVTDDIQAVRRGGEPIGYDEAVHLMSTVESQLVGGGGFHPHSWTDSALRKDPVGILERLREMIGTVLGQAVEQVRREAHQTVEAAPDFPTAFLAQVPEQTEFQYLIPPGVLREKIDEVCAAASSSEPGTWRHEVTGTVREFGEGLPARTEVPRETFTATRLAALCLAGEPSLSAHQAMFWEIVAGLTALEQSQENGLLSGAIVLAVG